MLKRNFLIVLIIISYVCKGNDDAYHQFEKGNSFTRHKNLTVH